MNRLSGSGQVAVHSLVCLYVGEIIPYPPFPFKQETAINLSGLLIVWGGTVAPLQQIAARYLGKM